MNRSSTPTQISGFHSPPGSLSGIPLARGSLSPAPQPVYNASLQSPQSASASIVAASSVRVVSKKPPPSRPTPVPAGASPKHAHPAGEESDDSTEHSVSESRVVGGAEELIEQLNRALQSDEYGRGSNAGAASAGFPNDEAAPISNVFYPPVDSLRRELQQDITHSRKMIKEELEWWGAKISKEAKTVEDLKVIQSQFKVELEQHKERMMEEFSQLKGRIEDESKRAREAEDIVQKLKHEVDWLQGQLYHELRKIWDHIRSGPSPARSTSSTSTASKPASSEVHAGSPKPEIPSIANFLARLQPHSTNSAANGKQAAEGSVSEPGAAPVADPSRSKQGASIHDNTRIKKLLEESRQKLQEEIAVLKLKLQEESHRASTAQEATNRIVERLQKEDLTGFEPEQAANADFSFEEEFGLDGANDAFMADIEDLRRRVELEEQLDASWQTPPSQTNGSMHPSSTQAWGSDESEDIEITSDDSFDYESFAEDTDDYHEVWDDGEYVYPLISFPQPIPDLLKREPKKGALKTRPAPEPQPLPAKTPAVVDEPRRVNFTVGVHEYEIQEGLRQNLRPGNAFPAAYYSDESGIDFTDGNGDAQPGAVNEPSVAIGQTQSPAPSRQFGMFAESPM